QLDRDDECWIDYSCGYWNSSLFEGYQGGAANFLNANPAPWATYATTIGSVTGSQYDMNAEIDYVIDFAKAGGAAPLVNYADRWNGSTATASSDDPAHPAYAAINGDRTGVNWGMDPNNGSG